MAVNDNTSQQLLFSCIAMGIIPMCVLMVGFPIYWTSFIQPCTNEIDTTRNTVSIGFCDQPPSEGLRSLNTEWSPMQESGYSDQTVAKYRNKDF